MPFAIFCLVLGCLEVEKMRVSGSRVTKKEMCGQTSSFTSIKSVVS